MREFSPNFRSDLDNLMKWRRDVRHFKSDAVPSDLLDTCLSVFDTAPSVGLSQPSRIVHIKSPKARQNAVANFQSANANALKGYDGERAKLYASLKLSGMNDAPEHFAIFCADNTAQGAGLGTKTMPETRRYSVVSAIMSFWLMTRSYGLGLGWVSIINPVRLSQDLDVSENWSLIAYLCIGWPKQNTQTPELETLGWEKRSSPTTKLIER